MKHGIRTFVFIECKMPCLKLGEDPVEEIKAGRATILQVISEEKLSLLFKKIQNLHEIDV